MTEKRCPGCGQTKPLAEFNRRASARSGRAPRCRPCAKEAMRAWRDSNPERAREISRNWRLANPDYKRGNRLSKYGLTFESFDAMLSEQGGRCAACLSTEPGGHGRWHVDHDHACCPVGGSCGSCVRGLLCHSCNLALGHVRDRRETLLALVAYLDRSRVGT